MRNKKLKIKSEKIKIDVVAFMKLKRNRISTAQMCDARMVNREQKLIIENKRINN